MDVRRMARHLLTRSNIHVPVLSYQELVPEFNVQPLGALTKGSQPENKASDAVGQSAEQHLKLGTG
jgi:type III secretion protein V